MGASRAIKNSNSRYTRFAVVIVLVQVVFLLNLAEARAEVFGLISATQGEVLLVSKPNDLIRSAKVGMALSLGDEVLCKQGEVLRFIDKNGWRYVLVGPAHATVVRGLGSDSRSLAFDLTRGILAVEGQNTTAREASTHLSSAALVVHTKSSGVLWVHEAQAQWVTLGTGVARAWHPLLTEDVVKVEQGFYTETSRITSYLGPRRVQRSDKKSEQNINKYFGEFFAAPVEVEEKIAQEQKTVEHVDHAQPVAAREPAATAPKAVPTTVAPPEEAPVPVDPILAHNTVRPMSAEELTLLRRLQARINGEEFNAIVTTKPKITAEELRRLAERDRKAKLTAARERSLRAAMGSPATTEQGRMPASVASNGAAPKLQPKLHIEQGQLSQLIEEDFPQDQPGIINRLIQGSHGGGTQNKH